MEHSIAKCSVLSWNILLVYEGSLAGYFWYILGSYWCLIAIQSSTVFDKSILWEQEEHAQDWDEDGWMWVRSGRSPVNLGKTKRALSLYFSKWTGSQRKFGTQYLTCENIQLLDSYRAWNTVVYCCVQNTHGPLKVMFESTAEFSQG